MNIIKTLDVRGDACPLPVIKAKKALKGLSGGALEIVTDSQATLESLSRMAANAGYAYQSDACDAGFRVLIDAGDAKPAPVKAAPVEPLAPASPAPAAPTQAPVALIQSDRFGDADEAAGKALMKSCIYSLTQLSPPPSKVILYTRGVLLACEGSESLADLRALEAGGCQILTCGASLNYCGVTEKLAVGSITSMFAIVETVAAANHVIRL